MMRPQWIKAFTWFLIIVIVLAVLLSAFLLFFPQFLPSSWPNQLNNNDRSDRIALAQLAMEFAGVLALSWVAWEFYQSQKKPKLRLRVKNLHERDENIIPDTKLRIKTESNRKIRIALYIENFGDAPARWINVNIWVKTKSNALKIISKDNPAGKWSEPKGSTALQHIFYGGDDLIVYAQPRNDPDLFSWLDNIGYFEFTNNNWEEYPRSGQGRIYLHYSIKAHGFSGFKQKIPIDVIG